MEMIEASLEDRIPDTVAAYLSNGAEPGTLQLVAWLAANRVRVLLPVLSHPIGGRLDKPAWAPYEGPDALRVGAYSILEPTGDVVPSEQLPEAVPLDAFVAGLVAREAARELWPYSEGSGSGA